MNKKDKKDNIFNVSVKNNNGKVVLSGNAPNVKVKVSGTKKGVVKTD